MKNINLYKTFILSFLCFNACYVKAQHSDLQMLVNQKKYTEVIGYTTCLNKSDSIDFKTMYAIGQAYEGVLKYNIAYKYYQHCLSLDTTHIDILNTIARTAAYIGKTKEAEKYFLQVLKQDSTDFYANYQLARLYMQAGRNTYAIDQFDYLLQQDSVNPVLLRNIGDCYSRMDNLPQAVIYYMKSFQQNKENAILASTLINTLLLMQETENALMVCDTALQYNPDNLLLYQNKGLVLFTHKDYTEADHLYSNLIIEGDSSYKTLKYGAISKYYAGKYMDSIEPLELAFQKDTTSVEVCLFLGSALGRTYDRKKAFELFDHAEKLMQPNVAYVNMLKQFRAETLVRDGNIDKGATLYYELWMSNKKSNYLAQIWQLYRIPYLAKTTKETLRQRYLFINTLIASEYLNENKGKTIQYHVRKQLEQFHEDMFFRGIREHVMLSPDDKKTTITLEKLNALIQKLPDKMPTDDENINDEN